MTVQHLYHMLFPCGRDVHGPSLDRCSHPRTWVSAHTCARTCQKTKPEPAVGPCIPGTIPRASYKWPVPVAMGTGHFYGHGVRVVKIRKTIWYAGPQVRASRTPLVY